MCLDLRKDCGVPYNGSKIRWKIASVRVNKLGRTCYRGPYTNKEYSRPGVWMNATRDYSYDTPSPTDIGFHVFTSRRAARLTKQRFVSNEGIKVVKVEVDGFIASGEFRYEQSETWKKMRIL